MTHRKTLRAAMVCAPVALTAVLLVLPIANAEARCVGADAVPTARTAPQARAATFCLLNRIRRSAGLPRLHRNRSLRGAASAYSGRMVSQGFFDHVSPDGGTVADRVKATRYLRGHWPRFQLGENIGMGDGALATPRSMVNAWMNSPPHRANILYPGYRDIGLGIVPGMPGQAGVGATYTTDFGMRSHR